MSTAGIRFVAEKGVRSVQLLCRVKPGVNAQREGIGAVLKDRIEVFVAPQAKDGEANKAVREVLAEVMKVPKSDVEIMRGMKSRDKTVIINLMGSKWSPDEEIERIRMILQGAAR